jgi:hypothetical protein
VAEPSADLDRAGAAVEAANLLWCTGLRPDFGRIDLPVFGDDGLQWHHRGVVESGRCRSTTCLVRSNSTTPRAWARRSRSTPLA